MFVAATGVRKKDGSCGYVALESRVVGLYSGRLPFAEHLDIRQFFLFFAQTDPALSKTGGSHHFKHSRARVDFDVAVVCNVSYIPWTAFSQDCTIPPRVILHEFGDNHLVWK